MGISVVIQVDVATLACCEWLAQPFVGIGILISGISTPTLCIPRICGTYTHIPERVLYKFLIHHYICNYRRLLRRFKSV